MEMSIFDTVGGWVSSGLNAIGNLFGGGSSSDGGRDRDSYSSSSESYHTSKVTNYDPDKVKVAELENERVGLMKEAQLEITEFNTKMEAAMIQARCLGFQAMQQAMMGMLKEVNVLAEERFVLLENGSREQVQKVEAMYADLKTDVQYDDFLQNKVPQLLNLANQFPEGSDMRQTFMKGIDQEMATHFSFKTNQLTKLNERCQVVVTSVVSSKERMQAHIDTVITKRIEQLEHVMQSNAKLEFKSPVLQLDSPKQTETAKLEQRVN
jgi:hypothetical protein